MRRLAAALAGIAAAFGLAACSAATPSAPRATVTVATPAPATVAAAGGLSVSVKIQGGSGTRYRLMGPDLGGDAQLTADLPAGGYLKTWSTQKTIYQLNMTVIVYALPGDPTATCEIDLDGNAASNGTPLTPNDPTVLGCTIHSTT